MAFKGLKDITTDILLEDSLKGDYKIINAYTYAIPTEPIILS
jgi:hypothetical protein